MAQKSCSRCGTRAEYFVKPYWQEDGICSDCCFELNRAFDAEGWPEGRLTEGGDYPEDPDARVYVVGLPGAKPVPTPVAKVLAPKVAIDDSEPF